MLLHTSPRGPAPRNHSQDRQSHNHKNPLKVESDERVNLARSEISKTVVSPRLVIASAAVTEKSAHFETSHSTP